MFFLVLPKLKAEHPNFNIFPSPNFSIRNEFFTYGPAVHLNFWGDNKPTLSWGLEVSYWTPIGKGSGSVNMGFELDQKKIRFYSEAQTGLVLIGASAGLFAQIPRYKRLDAEEAKSAKLSYGFQGELWGGALGYIDLKFRLGKKCSSIAPGCLIRLFHEL